MDSTDSLHTSVRTITVFDCILSELQVIRTALDDRTRKEKEEKRLTNTGFNRTALAAIINSNLVVSIFGGALTLPILSGNSDTLANRLVTTSFLFFGTNTISCLFWLLRVSLPDQTDLTDDLSSFEKVLLVLVGTIGHTLFNFAGLLLLAATAATYSSATGYVCVGVMGATATIYACAGWRYLSQIRWSRLNA